jgi:hypothetical protein
MLQAMSIDKWSLLTNAITLLVITATAVAALIQLRHLRAQNTLNAELAILKDWNDPQFRQWRLYVAGEMQTKIKIRLSWPSTMLRKSTARGTRSFMLATGSSRSARI